jgi:hypothetical protein
MNYTPIEKLTVGQYQALYEIYSSSAEEIDKSIASISLLTGLSPEEVEDLPIDQWRQMSAEVAELYLEPVQDVIIPKFIELKSGTYALCKINELRISQIVDLKKYIGKAIVPHFHKIAVCVLRPVSRVGPLQFWRKYDRKKKDELAEEIRQSNFMLIHGLCVYLVNLWNLTVSELRPAIKIHLATHPVLKDVDPQVKEILEGEFVIDNHYPLALSK